MPYNTHTHHHTQDNLFQKKYVGRLLAFLLPQADQVSNFPAGIAGVLIVCKLMTGILPVQIRWVNAVFDKKVQIL
jgi:hypothetical protein